MSTTQIQKMEEEATQNDFVASSTVGWDTKGVVYLSGPIRKAEDNGSSWRNKIIEDYGDKFEFINPLDRHNPEEVEILNHIGQFDESSNNQQVLPDDYVTDDKIEISKSEYMFVGLPDIVSRGTAMEMMFCHFTNTPFFVWKMDGQEESGWVHYHAEFVSDDRDEVMGRLMEYE